MIKATKGKFSNTNGGNRMTSNIIYHDFRNNAPSNPTTPRIVKTAPHVNNVLHTLCIFLCGACTAISILALVAMSFV